MSGSGIRVKVDDSPFQEGFNKLLKKTKNLEPLMDDIGEYLVADTDDRFDQEKGPDGEQWYKSKRAKEEGGKTLTDNKNLRKSITPLADNSSVIVGTNVEYAAIHQFGGEIKQPKRDVVITIEPAPFLGINEENADEIIFKVGEFLHKQ